ncbi:hypothetical protein K5549_021793, partial [Capra hircus]
MALGLHPWPSALSGSERHATEIGADMPGSRSTRGHSRPPSGDTPALGSSGPGLTQPRCRRRARS